MFDKFLAAAITSSNVTTLGGLVEAGELDLLEESLVKLCPEHSESLSEAMLSENREESESLGWSSPTHCFSPLKGILCYSSEGEETAPGLARRQAEKGD